MPHMPRTFQVLRPRILSIVTAIMLFTASQAVPVQAHPQPSTNATTYTLDTVTVTADKRAENIQNVPASISVMTGDQVETYGIDSSTDIFNRTPNLHVVQLGPKATSTSFASMRGISSYMTGNPAIGFYVDDVYYPGFEINLFDIERYEVLRGPQGTLYGRNTEAGVVNIITKKATNEWSSKMSAGLASHNTQNVEGYVSGPLVQDKLFVRGAASYKSTNGFFTNEFDDDRAVDEQREADGRFDLRWLPTDKLDLRLTTDIQSYHGNYAEFAPLDGIKDNPHKVDVDWPGEADKDALGTSLRAEYKMKGMKLLSITALRNEQSNANNDLDFTPMDLMRLYIDREDTLFSQELRLLSDTGDFPLEWLAGAYLFHEETDTKYTSHFGRLSGMAGDFHQDSLTKTLGTALFAQGSYLFFDRLKFTAGLRYDREAKDFDYQWSGTGPYGSSFFNRSGSSDKTYDAWLPKASLSYTLTENIMPYLSVARGFKSGGFNIKADAGKAYDSEFTWSYEAGVKTEWLDNRLQFNLAAFYIDWTDLQVEQPNYPDFTIDNAGSAKSQGFEAEIKAYPITGLEILGGFGLTQAEYTEYDRGTLDMAGKKIAGVPELSGQLGATYRFVNGLFVNADYVYTGSSYFDALNTRKQGGYQTVNAKVGYEDETYELALWAKNLTDTKYATRAFAMSDTWYGRAGDPLTFGLTGTVRF